MVNDQSIISLALSGHRPVARYMLGVPLSRLLFFGRAGLNEVCVLLAVFAGSNLKEPRRAKAARAVRLTPSSQMTLLGVYRGGELVARPAAGYERTLISLTTRAFRNTTCCSSCVEVHRPEAGKSYIAKAICTTRRARDYKMLYREAHRLIEHINEARELGEIKKYRAQLKSTELLVIDDPFLSRLPAKAGEELADVLKSR